MHVITAAAAVLSIFRFRPVLAAGHSHYSTFAYGVLISDESRQIVPFEAVV